MKLRLFNTKGRKVQEFTPQEPPVVRMYCCGPTVYHDAHIGNLRTYINQDFLRRALEVWGFEVHHVVNITDVGHLTSDADEGDDKMEKGARREGLTVWEIARRYTDKFLADWDRLNLLPPLHWPRATEYIAEQIDLVRALEERGFTYTNHDGVYFDTARFPRYLEFSGIRPKDLLAGSRVDMGDKRNLTDFALWKLTPSGVCRAMEWDSPWGRGFPGWHVECSAMAGALLGKTLDIHCGGTDHVRVHHTNEIAQSECAQDGVEFARFWFHGEFLKLEDTGKMSKSTGQFLTLTSLEEVGFHALDYRFFCAGAHYRTFLTFNWANLAAAHQAHRALRRRCAPLIAAWFAKAAGRANEVEELPLSEPGVRARAAFMDAVGFDLNIPRALGALQTTVRDDSIDASERGRLILEADRILGFDLGRELTDPPAAAMPEDFRIHVEKLVALREEARARRDWTQADRIRQELTGCGVLLVDTPEGPVWLPLPGK